VLTGVVCVYFRVAQQESSNCMSAHGLAIVFAPSVLRTSRPMSPMESLRDVAKQATSVFITAAAVTITDCSSDAQWQYSDISSPQYSC